jgi:hypothetical protein
MGKQNLDDYKNMGVVTMDAKEQTFTIWIQELVKILVMKGSVQTAVHAKEMRDMKQWISAVMKFTPAIYHTKVSKHDTLNNT